MAGILHRASAEVTPASKARDHLLIFIVGLVNFAQYRQSILELFDPRPYNLVTISLYTIDARISLDFGIDEYEGAIAKQLDGCLYGVFNYFEASF